MVQSLGFFALATIPWMVRLYSLASKFAHTWYFPVDLRLFFSVLGNLFVGYEGTPWFLWNMTMQLSVLLIVAGIAAYIPKKTRPETSMFLTLMIVPVVIVLGISVVKPLYVYRYLIPVSVSEIFVVCYALLALPSRMLQRIAAAVIIGWLIWFNCWYPPQHKKTDLRTPVKEAESLLGPNDILLADDSLSYFETLFYATDKRRVFLYNPTGSAFPWYVGESIFSESRQLRELPQYPAKAYSIHADGTYQIEYSVTPTGSAAAQ